jgi:hypothetical protein
MARHATGWLLFATICIATISSAKGADWEMLKLYDMKTKMENKWGETQSNVGFVPSQ